MSETSVYCHRCWIDGKLQPATVHIRDGKITSIEFGYKNDVNPDDGQILMPGVIDAHVHINEPGRTDWEGFETATAAAVAGGITTLVDMPLNSSPVTTSVENLEIKIASTVGKLRANVGFYGGVVPGNTAELKGLADMGVLGFKCFLVHSGIDEFPNVTRQDLEEAMPVIASTSRPLLVHCELDDHKVWSDLAGHPGKYHEWVKSRPGLWEVSAVSMMAELSARHSCPIHIVHVSESSVLNIIADARNAGLPVTAETCPHYLLFCEEDIPDSNTLYKCAPPIRNRANNRQLAEALKVGLLDLVASDHSPAPPGIKEIPSGNLLRAWGGIAGLQFLLPASWTALKQIMGLETYVPLVTEKPAAMLGLDDRKGYIRTGYDADLVLWKPEEKFAVRQNDILHRHKASPYEGLELYGKTKSVMVNGIKVFGTGSEESPAGKIILGHKKRYN